jgi:hypothetical protein
VAASGTVKIVAPICFRDWQSFEMSAAGTNVANPRAGQLLARILIAPGQLKNKESVLRRYSMPADIFAINLALLPDETMNARARAVNQQIRENYPNSFPLDDTHLPHITLMQAFVKHQDLEAGWNKVKGIAIEDTLTAEALDFHGSGDTATAGFDVDQPLWLKLAHQQTLDIVAPASVPDGDDNAFVTTDDEPTIAGRSLYYVRNYRKAHAGNKYNPHLTLGVGPQDLLKRLRHEHEPFDFHIEALAICQLGNFGTCRKVLFSRRI